MNQIGKYLFGLLVVYLLAFYALSFVILVHHPFKLPDHMYQNLHAMEYPMTISNLALLTFPTPALPIRLASAWEIQNALKIRSDALLSAYSTVYPLMDETNDLYQLLLKQANTTGNKNCPACEAQKVFTFENRLVESQKQYYCPRRGENKSA